MILLYKNTTSTVTVTVTEKTTLSDPFYYLFVINRDQTNTPVYCIASNTSTETQRYDSFSITETTSPNYLAGEVELSEATYTYDIYAVPGDPGMLIDPKDYSSGELTETGILKCIDSSNNSNTEYPDAPLTNTVYE